MRFTISIYQVPEESDVTKNKNFQKQKSFKVPQTKVAN